MKITDIEAIHLRVEDPGITLFDGSYDDCVIIIHTDEGLAGVGETESLAPAIQAIIDAPSAHNHARGLKEVLLSRDPLEPDLWQQMYAATDYIGRRGLVMHAIGGIDLALWDLRGKILGKPVHSLLDDAKREPMPAYGPLYPLQRATDGVAQQVEEGKQKNLRAFKFCADPWWKDDLGLTRELLLAARTAAGPDVRLIVDAALSYKTAEEGLSILRLLTEIDVWFLEAPYDLMTSKTTGKWRDAACRWGWVIWPLPR